MEQQWDDVGAACQAEQVPVGGVTRHKGEIAGGPGAVHQAQAGGGQPFDPDIDAGHITHIHFHPAVVNFTQPFVHAGEVHLVQPALVVAFEEFIREHQAALERFDILQLTDAFLLCKAPVDRYICQVVGMVCQDDFPAQPGSFLDVEFPPQRPGLCHFD